MWDPLGDHVERIQNVPLSCDETDTDSLSPPGCSLPSTSSAVIPLASHWEMPSSLPRPVTPSGRPAAASAGTGTVSRGLWAEGTWAPPAAATSG